MIKKYWDSLRSYYRVQRIARYMRPYMPARPRWKRLLAIQSLTEPTEKAKKILIATSTGSHWAMSGFESVLAAALRLREAHVEALLCDGILPACQECDLRLFPGDLLLKENTHPLCKTCFSPAHKMFSELTIPVLAYSEWLLEDDRIEIEMILRHTSDSEINQLSWRGIAVGEHASAGALRFFGRGNLSGEKYGVAISRQYLRAALFTTAILQHLLKINHYDAVVFHHGIYVPQGIIGDVCRQQNIPVINWHPAYRSRTYLFSHGDTYHKTMIDESCDQWENIHLDDKKDKMVMHYLESRRLGSHDWISFKHNNSFSRSDIIKLGLDPHKPIIGLLTNVMWDAQLHFRHNAFSSMQEWLFFTVDYFIRRLDLQLLIRIHPAEVSGGVPSRQGAEDEIRARFSTLPSNICIVGAHSPLDTYALMQECDTVLVYGTKMAIELPCWGLPVIVAGEAWARGKGFTIDVLSEQEFHQLLESLPLKKLLDKEKIKRARQYAYHLFFRRMIPVQFARRFSRLVPFAYDISSIDMLMPGKDKGLDVICDSILTGKPFIYEDMAC